MKLNLAEHGGRLRIRPEFSSIGDERIIGSTPWLGDKERFAVLTVRGGKIVDMQECRTRNEAERFARRR